MDQAVTKRNGESAAHADLKRLALLWAQAQGYSACGCEVSLPRSRYRADVAAYRPGGRRICATAIFECKQALSDLRRDNRRSAATQKRLEAAHRRRTVLETRLRVHYPALRIADSLFAEFDSHDFAAIGHRGYNQVLRQLTTLQHRLVDNTKFESLTRYRCANLFFLVLPIELLREPEVPLGWGVLVATESGLRLCRKPVWHDIAERTQICLLERIAAAGTRSLNRQTGVTFEEIALARSRLT
jgi:hypothetical protein